MTLLAYDTGHLCLFIYAKLYSTQKKIMKICTLKCLSIWTTKIINFPFATNGQVVEWLGYGEESRHKVVSSRLGFAMPRLENSLSTQQ